jgi:hypothetical protein
MTFSISSSPNVPGGYTTYQWSGPNGFSSTLPNPSVDTLSALNQGVYTLVVTLGECTTTKTQFIPVLDMPPPFVAVSGNYCGQTLSFDLQPDNYDSYSWTGPCGFTSTIAEPIIPQIPMSCGGQYCLTVTKFSCVTNFCNTVNIENIPPPNSYAPDFACTGETLVFSVSGVKPGNNYVWKKSGVVVGTQPNMVIPNPNPSMAGIYTLEMIEGPCTTSKSHTVNIFPTPLAPPFLNSNSPLCVGDTLKLEAGIVDGAEQYIWEGPAFANPQSTPTQFKNVLNVQQSMSGVYSVKVTINGCPSQIKTTNVVVHPIPSSPTSSPASRCGPGLVTLTAAMGSVAGDFIRVYTVPTGGAPIATSSNIPPYEMNVPVTTTTTVYLESVVSSTSCRGPRTPVQITVFPQPDPPVFTPPSRCGPGSLTFTAQMGATAGTSIILYTQAGAPDGTPLTQSSPGIYSVQLPSISSSYTFYVRAVLPNPQLPPPGCQSPLTPVPVTIHPIPAPPNAPGQIRCGPGRVTFSASLNDAIANQVNLYTSHNVSLSPIATDGAPPYLLLSDSVSTSTTFYATAVNAQTGCQSSPQAVQLLVITPPGPPSAPPLALCGPGTANFVAQMGSPNGEGIRLYTQATGGAPLFTQNNAPYIFAPSISTTTTLYLESYKIEMGLTCPSARAPLPVTVHPVPGLPSAQNIEVCAPGRVTITAIMGNPPGEGILFYTPQSGSNPMYNTTTPPYEFTEVVTTTTTYHIQSYIGQCSSQKVPVTVTIHTPPPAPASGALERCGPGTVTFTPTFNPPLPTIRLLLYSSPFGGAQPLATATLNSPVITIPEYISSSTSYYLEAVNTVTSCTSARSPVPIIIKPIPDPPQAQNVSRCAGANLPIVFTATMGAVAGTEVRLYTTPTGGSPVIAQTPPYQFTIGLPIPSTTTTYYLESFLNGCVSSRSTVQAIIIPNPGTPIAPNVARCGAGPVTITGQMGSPAGNVLRLFTEGCGGLPITTSGEGFTQLTIDNLVTTTTYYLQAFDTQTGCAGPCSEVVATLNPLPPVPQSSGGERCGCGAVTFTAASIGIINVYDSENAMVPTSSAQAPNSFTRTICATSTYWLEAKNPFTNCVSARVPVELTVHPVPEPPKAQDIEICQAQTVTLTFEPGSGGDFIILYTQGLGGPSTLLNAPYTYTANITENFTYHASTVNHLTSCLSPPKSVSVSIKPELTPPLAFVAQRCGPGNVTITAVMQAPPGSQVRFYSPQSNLIGTVSPSPYIFVHEITTHTTFWVERFDPAAGCSSQKATIVATVLPLPAPPSAPNVQICGPGIVTLKATPGPLIPKVSFTNVPYGGVEEYTATAPPFEYSAHLSATTTYCVKSIDNNNCESPCQQVIATVQPLPPTIEVPPVHFCKGQAVTFTVNHPAEITGLSLYTSSASGVGQPIQTASGSQFTLTNLSASTDFFVEGVSSITGCATQRAQASAILVPAPPPPSALSVARCGPGGLTFTATHSEAIPYIIRFLSAGNNLIASSPTSPALFSVDINTTTAYKIINEHPIYGCPSEPTLVTATIHPFPNPPTAQDLQRCGPGAAIFTLQANQAGVGIRIYTQSSGGQLIANLEAPPFIWSSSEVTTSTTFYAETYFLATGCVSQRIAFRLTVAPVPLPPQAQAAPICNPGVTQFSFSAQSPAGSKIRLYTLATPGAPITAEYDLGQSSYPSPFIQATTTFYVSIWDPITGCEGSRAPLEAIVQPVGPPSAPPVSRCGNGTLTLTASMGSPSGTEIRLYNASQVLVASSSTVPYLITTPILTTHATFFIEAYNSVTGCFSSRIPVELSVHLIPGAPSVGQVSRCGGGSLTFTINNGNPAGTSIAVRLTEQGGAIATLLTQPYTFTTPNLTQTTTYYFVSANNVTGCQSPPTPGVAQIYQVPAAPSAQNVSICQGGTITFTAQMQQPAGNRLEFYNANLQLLGSSSQTTSFFSDSVAQTQVYFFKAINTSTGCTSALAQATAFVIPNPAPPTATARAACFSSTVTIAAQMGNLAGNQVILYDANFSALDTAKAAPFQFTRTIPGTTTYYLRSYNSQAGCISPPVSLVAELLTVTPLPIAQNVSRCGPGAVTFTFTSPSGAQFFIYPGASGNNLLAASQLPATTVIVNNVTSSITYYAEARLSSSQCPSPRTPVRVDILPLPPTPLTQNPRICGPGAAQFSASLPSSSASFPIQLLSEQGNLLSQVEQAPYNFTTPALAQTTTFYLHAIDPQTGCKSVARQVIAEVAPLPPPPLVPPVARCGPGSVTLTATSPIAVELQNGTGGVLARAVQNPKLLTTPVLNTNTTLIAVAGPQNGCYSQPVEVNITILPLPPPPLALPISRCGPGLLTFTILNSDPSISRVHVYNHSGEFLDTLAVGSPYTVQLARSRVFQFANFDGVCLSRRVSAEATILPIPAPPFANPIKVCSPHTFDNIVFTANMRQPEGAHIALYSVAQGGTIISSSGSAPYTLTAFAPISGTQTYYLETIDLNTNCVSERVPVLAHLYPIPPPPSIPNVQICGPGAATFTVEAGAYEEVAIYEQIGQEQAYRRFTSFPAEFTQTYLQSTTYFYAESKNPSTGCKSDRIVIEAKVLPLPPRPVVDNNGPLCPGQTLVLRVQALDNLTYRWKGPGGFTATGAIIQIPNTSSAQDGVYEVTAVNEDGCVSPVNGTNVTIYPTLAVPAPGHYNVFLEDVPYCEGVEINLHVLNYPAYPEGTMFEWKGPQGFHSFPHPFPGVGRPTTVANSGVYSVRAIYERCTTEWAETQVVIHPRPQKPVVEPPAYLCLSEATFTLNVSEPKPTETYHWIGPNNWLSEGVTIERPIRLENAGAYSIVAVSDKNCISDTGTVNVEINNEPFTVTAAYKTNLCEGEWLSFDIVAPLPNTTYTLVGPNDFKVISQLPSLNKGAVSLQDSGVYTLFAQRNGCISPVARYPVKVLPRPAPPQIQAPQQLCQGQRMQLRVTEDAPNASYLWYLPEGRIIEGNTYGVPSFQPTHAGVYSVVRIVEGCTSLATSFTVNLAPAPRPPMAYLEGNFCLGDSAQLHAKLLGWEGAEFLWSGPGAFRSTLASPKVYATQPATYSVIAVIGGCASLPALVRVSPTPLPPRPQLASSVSVCQGAPFTLSVNNPLAGATYLWKKEGEILPNQQGSSYLATNSHASLHHGTYTVAAIANNCTSQAATIRVEVINPQISLIAQAPLCQGETLYLRAQPSAIAGDVSFYEFTGPNQFRVTSEHPEAIRSGIQISESGEYGVLWIYRGCTARAATQVTVLSRPAAPLVQSWQLRCVGENIILSATPNASTSYYWQGPGGFVATGNPVILQASNIAQSGVYEVFGIAQGCTSARPASLQVEIAEAPAPPSPLAVAPLCKGETLFLSVRNPEPTLQYRWIGPQGWAGSGAEQSITSITPERSGMYSVVAISGPCSSAAGVVNVQVGEIPQLPTFSFPSTLCSGQNLTLAAQAIAGATYAWLLPDGSWREGPSPILSLPQVGTNASGVYGLRISLGNCVSKIVTERIEVRATPPAPIARHNGPLCQGQDLNLQATGAPGARYFWSAPEAVAFDRTQQNPTITSVGTWASGNYSVQAIQEGCTSQVISLQILVREKPEAPAASVNSPICAGESLQLFASSPNAATYQWVGPSSVSPTGWSSNQQNPMRSNVTTAESGKYTVWAIKEGCVSEVTGINVVVKPTPRISSASNNGPVCEGSPLHLFASFQSGVQYQWSGPNGFSSTLQNPIIENVSSAQSGVYSLIAIANGCTSGLTVTNVEIIAPPFAPELGISVTWCNGQSVTLTAPVIGGVTYNWIGPAGVSAQGANLVIPSVSLRNQGVYRLFVRRDGCTFLVRQIAANVQQCNGRLESAATVTECTVYPNPSSGKFEITLNSIEEGAQLDYALWNVQGQKIQSGVVESSRFYLDLEDFASGIYQLRIYYQNQEYRLKLIKQ